LNEGHDHGNLGSILQLDHEEAGGDVLLQFPDFLDLDFGHAALAEFGVFVFFAVFIEEFFRDLGGFDLRGSPRAAGGKDKSETNDEEENAFHAVGMSY
jgi:hypothetical protein